MERGRREKDKQRRRRSEDAKGRKEWVAKASEGEVESMGEADYSSIHVVRAQNSRPTLHSPRLSATTPRNEPKTAKQPLYIAN